MGSIIFLVHIYDISEDKTPNIRLFADNNLDDCVCNREIDNINDRRTLEDDINKLGRWATTWGMRFQPVKYNMMTLSKKRNNTNFNYTLKKHKPRISYTNKISKSAHHRQ